MPTFRNTPLMNDRNHNEAGAEKSTVGEEHEDLKSSADERFKELAEELASLLHHAEKLAEIIPANMPPLVRMSPASGALWGRVGAHVQALRMYGERAVGIACGKPDPALVATMAAAPDDVATYEVTLAMAGPTKRGDMVLRFITLLGDRINEGASRIEMLFASIAEELRHQAQGGRPSARAYAEAAVRVAELRHLSRTTYAQLQRAFQEAYDDLLRYTPS